MTIHEAIAKIDVLKPNKYGYAEKINWISNLDGVIKREIIDTHEGGENIVFNGYSEDTDINTILLVPAPYDDIYVRYLEMQIDYLNGETNKYSNSFILYNKMYVNFCNYYNRNYIPKGAILKFL